MKRILVVLILGLVASMPLNPFVYGDEDEKKGIMEIELSVQGMTCEKCVAKVKDALMAVEGVTSVEVELEEGEAEAHAKKGTDPEKLVAAVENAGFKAQISEVEYE